MQRETRIRTIQQFSISWACREERRGIMILWLCINQRRQGQAWWPKIGDMRLLHSLANLAARRKVDTWPRAKLILKGSESGRKWLLTGLWSNMMSWLRRLYEQTIRIFIPICLSFWRLSKWASPLVLLRQQLKNNNQKAKNQAQELRQPMIKGSKSLSSAQLRLHQQWTSCQHAWSLRATKALQALKLNSSQCAASSKLISILSIWFSMRKSAQPQSMPLSTFRPKLKKL